MSDIKNSNLAKSSALAAAATSSALILESPVFAQATPSTGITQVSDMVTSLGTLSAVVIPIVLGAMALRIGIKLVNRMTVKG